MKNLILSYQEINGTSTKILNEGKVNSLKLSFDIDTFAENLGFEIIPVEDLKHRVLREAYLDPQNRTIYVDTILYSNRKFEYIYRYTIAHEIAHYYLHFDYYKKLTDRVASFDEWIELYKSIPKDIFKLLEHQANICASCLLIPDSSIEKILKKIASPRQFYLFSKKRQHDLQDISNFKHDLDYIHFCFTMGKLFDVPSQVMADRLFVCTYRDIIPSIVSTFTKPFDKRQRENSTYQNMLKSGESIAFNPDEISESTIMQILKAGHHTAFPDSFKQCHISVMRKLELEYIQDDIRQLAKRRPLKASENYLIDRFVLANAQALILISHDESCPESLLAIGAVAQNVILAAKSFGLGYKIVNEVEYILDIDHSKNGNIIKNIWGVPQNYTFGTAIALGRNIVVKLNNSSEPAVTICEGWVS